MGEVPLPKSDILPGQSKRPVPSDSCCLMSTWIVGDVHGCYRTFLALLRRCRYEEQSDRLILVGDLVNGGPDSLQVLRWAQARSDRIDSVLGNHDLYFLGRWSGACSRKKRDTLASLLAAPDVDCLAEWLRRRPLTITEPGFRIVHAGLLPEWTWAESSRLALELQEELRGSQLAKFLRAYFRVRRDSPKQRSPRKAELLGALQTFCLVRVCSRQGLIYSDFKGSPEHSPRGFRPWYEHSHNWAGKSTLFFGHWAACGYRRLGHAICLDSGCVWGKQMTAYRVEDGKVVQQPSLERG